MPRGQFGRELGMSWERVGTGCDLACRRQSPRQSALVDRRRRRLTSPSECSSGDVGGCRGMSGDVGEEAMSVR